jgi:polar amino acid transport system ATP-binding protein
MTEAPRDQGQPILRIENLRKQFGDHAAVDDVSLDVRAGEVVAIIGPSGSGKSTLLRCINLLESPSSGRITMDGVPTEVDGAVGQRELMALRRKVGMVFQSFNLFPHLTVLRNISLPQERVLGRSRAEADKRSMALLEQVGLAAKASAHPPRCSGGQQQRVAIARALALDPKVMLFDEPTSALDPELGLEVLSVMRQLADEGMTMIVVTHEIHFAADVADRLIVMADGKIIEQGDPKTVIADPQVPRTRTFLSAIRDR